MKKVSFEKLWKSYRIGLGVSELIPEWKDFFSFKYLKDDVIAGLTVACVAVPLSLAIALASGVEPANGLISAIVAGIVCALFGGTPLSVSGPAAAMTVLIADTVQNFGMGGLLVVGLGCGLLQLFTGVFRLGQIIRFVPLPVVAGFTAGIGAIIFIGQLPRAMALPPPDQSHILDVILHISELFRQTHMGALTLAVSTVTITFLLPRYLPKLPAPLIAVLIPTVAASILGMNVQTIGSIPNELPLPKFPIFPKENLGELFEVTLMVFALASLETLLSSSAVDKLSKAKRHDPDQELIGQGLGNISVCLFGGIPITGVIARSALNIQSGAKSRRAAIIHACVLLAVVFFFAPLMSRIPTAVLAGVLLSVALRMLHPREFLQLWRSSQIEAFVYALTFVAIVFTDLVMGVQAGVMAALVIAAIRLGRTQIDVEGNRAGSIPTLSINGPLTFLSSSTIETVRQDLPRMDLTHGLVIDMSGVSTMDASGADQLVDILNPLLAKKIDITLKGVSPICRKALLSHDNQGKIAKILARDSDVLSMVGNEGIRSMDRLVEGVLNFRHGLRHGYDVLFKKLADGQNPHTLFITCSDSRINPNLITSTAPGELFIVRNVGNIIPAVGKDSAPAEGAAVEFAVGVLGVKDVVVCGHSGCGAMKEILSESIFSRENSKRFPSIAQWLSEARDIKKKLPDGATPEQAAELNALNQLESLKTYPLIQEKLKKGELKLHAWFYDIGESRLEEWDENRKVFVEIGAKLSKSLEKRMEAGIQYQAPILEDSDPKPKGSKS